MNILFPTDFSKNSEAALNYAVDFTKSLNAKLTLLHVYTVPTMENVGAGGLSSFSTGPAARLQDKVQADVEEKVAKNMSSLMERYGLEADNCETIVKEGSVRSEMDKLIKENQYDLVILGTKGESSQRGIFFGGIAMHMIHKAGCPVLAVPNGANYHSVNKIVYPTDLVHEEMNNLNWLINYARLHKANVHLMHISDSYTETNKEEFEDIIHELPYDNITYETVHGEDVPHVILGVSKDENVSMIAMTTHTNTLFDRLFHSSLTADVLERITIPFIGFSDQNTKPYNFS